MTTLEEIDDLLPQTQCRQCGCDGCLAYARAILEEGAAINRCAPGGAEGIARLAAATGRPVVPLDPEYGREVPFAVARIRARDCIGCAWCIRVCPTDAIAGSPKHLHGIVEERCTGCALCLPACPMDAIDMVENGRTWTLEDAHRAREHGGAEGIARLAAATGRPVVPLDPEYGREVPFAVARIRARDCIGCAWCIRVCPTDAIAGSPKHLHGIVEERCTGCALCLPACPMDAIDMVENGRTWTLEDAHRAREHHRNAAARRERLEAEDLARLDALRKPAAEKAAGGPSALIADIMARARRANAGDNRGGLT